MNNDDIIRLAARESGLSEAAVKAIAEALEDAVKAERKRCHDFLMNLHVQAGGKHNYYHVAARLLEEE